MKGKNVLVTGGAGFIGSHLSETLYKIGAKVRILDNLSTGKLENLIILKNIHFIQGDIRNYKDCLEACTDIEIVFHQAAVVSVPLSITNPLYNHDVNVTGSLNMLEAAKKKGVKKFIYASSAAVYQKYNSPYALAKSIVEDYTKLYDLETIGLRYFNVYGPRQDPNSPYSGVISIFSNNLKQNKTLMIFGDGTQTRDFVNVYDIVQANLIVANSDNLNKTSVYDVGSGNSTSLLQLISILENISEKSAKIEFKEPRIGDIKHSMSNITKIQELGYIPKINLNFGLNQLIDF